MTISLKEKKKCWALIENIFVKGVVFCFQNGSLVIYEITTQTD
jgi:hypothetical protein